MPRIGGRRVPLPFASTLSPEGQQAWSGLLNGDNELDNAIRNGTSVAMSGFRAVQDFVRDITPQPLIDATESLVAHVDEWGPFVMLGGVMPMSWRKITAVSQRYKDLPGTELVRREPRVINEDVVELRRVYETPDGTLNVVMYYDTPSNNLTVQWVGGRQGRMDLGNPSVAKALAESLLEFPRAQTIKYTRVTGARNQSLKALESRWTGQIDRYNSLPDNSPEKPRLYQELRQLAEEIRRANKNQRVTREIVP